MSGGVLMSTNKMRSEMLLKKNLEANKKVHVTRQKIKLFHSNFEDMSRGILTLYENNTITYNEKTMLKKMQSKAWEQPSETL